MRGGVCEVKRGSSEAADAALRAAATERGERASLLPLLAFSYLLEGKKSDRRSVLPAAGTSSTFLCFSGELHFNGSAAGAPTAGVDTSRKLGELRLSCAFYF